MKKYDTNNTSRKDFYAELDNGFVGKAVNTAKEMYGDWNLLSKEQRTKMNVGCLKDPLAGNDERYEGIKPYMTIEYFHTPEGDLSVKHREMWSKRENRSINGKEFQKRAISGKPDIADIDMA